MNATTPAVQNPATIDSDTSPRAAAIGTILREHRLLASVLILLDSLLTEVVNGGTTPDFTLIATILCYIDAFPERFHHPKENRYLFSALRSAAVRARDGECAAMVDRLEEEHRISANLLLGLQRCFIAYQAHLPGATSNFVNACAAYTRFHLDHMQVEESQLLPLAVQHLNPDEWAMIARAFAANADPLRGVDSERTYDRLRSRIVELLPDADRQAMLKAEADLQMLRAYGESINRTRQS